MAPISVPSIPWTFLSSDDSHTRTTGMPDNAMHTKKDASLRSPDESVDPCMRSRRVFSEQKSLRSQLLQKRPLFTLHKPHVPSAISNCFLKIKNGAVSHFDILACFISQGAILSLSSDDPDIHFLRRFKFQALSPVHQTVTQH